jgi:hypothetical protein
VPVPVPPAPPVAVALPILSSVRLMVGVVGPLGVELPSTNTVEV